MPGCAVRVRSTPACRRLRGPLPALLLLLLLFLPLSAAPAEAEITGNCTASISGVDVGGISSSDPSQAVVVSQQSAVPVRMQSSTPLTAMSIQLEFAGFRWTVFDRPTSGTSWQETVPVDAYARYGVGLYKVIGESRGAGGSCSGAALVRLTGDPLRTMAGIAGAAVAGVGLLGLATTSIGAALRGRGAVSFGGLVAGLLAGLGGLVLAQQYGVAYPTRELAIAGLAGGLAAGVVLPVLFRALFGRR